MENEVLEFIENFKKSHPEEIIDLFTNGYCYYFAIILDERFFKHGIIMYIPVYNHFCYKICNKLYDINGEISDPDMIKEAISWKCYIRKEPAGSYRIIRDSILK